MPSQDQNLGSIYGFKYSATSQLKIISKNDYQEENIMIKMQ